MISRRRFLATSTTLAATVGIAARAVAASTSSLPAAVAALPSFAGRVAPFTVAEYRARIERAQQKMDEQHLRAIVLANSTASTSYFARLRLGGMERFWALVLPAHARPILLCPHMEQARAAEMLAGGPLENAAEILPWEETQSPFALLADCLKARGIASGRVGLDEQMKWVFARGLMQAAPQLEFVSATPVTAGCRMIKEPHEIDCIRVAGAATLAVYQAVYHSLEVGMSSEQVNRLIAQAYEKVGLPGEASVNIDAYTASPHGSRLPQTLREGSILILDDGCAVEGYTSDLTRTFTLGKPTEKMRRVFDTVHAAQNAARATAGPGVATAVVDAAARKVVADAGYGPGFKFFTHRLGHGIGLDMHEWPYFVENNMFGEDRDPRLQANMILTAEPGIYIPGEFGIRLEDELLITNKGAEFLTPQSFSLDAPFARN